MVRAAGALFSFWLATINKVKILGIETSCDETSASVVKDGQVLLSNVVSSSVDLHKAYGGVVPEIAARSHIEVILPVIDQALADSGYDWPDIDALAVTYGPGLGGSLLVGIMTARTLAIAKSKPLYAVNHVAAHPFAAFLTELSPTLPTNYQLPTTKPVFPALALIVSGGHSQLVLFKTPLNYQVLGQTLDDAVGEAFDKVAKILGLPYPGGPSIAISAEAGDPSAIKLPDAKLNNPYDFSFSGLKTAVLRASQGLIGEDYTFPSTSLPERLSKRQKADISASFQMSAVKTLSNKTIKAIEEFNPKSLVVAGGVAANGLLRQQLNENSPLKPIFPDIKLCTDNGAMIATYAYYMASLKVLPADPYSLIPDADLKM